MGQDATTHGFSRADLLLFCKAVANIIGADRKVTPEERFQLGELIREAGLQIEDEDVSKAIDEQLYSPTPIEEVVKTITHPAMRRHLYRTLVEVACSDGVAPEEAEKLAKLAKVFELNTDAARELIDWTSQSIALEKRENDILARL
jgi:uncharacterized membrane protein YebE (DUF533 family)